MRNTDLIQKRLALFLLVVFALSATPKIFFHELLANHKDGLVCNKQDKSKPCLHRQAYHCQFDDLVVTAPYLSAVPAISLNNPTFVTQHEACVLPQTIAAPLRHVDSRGPPMM